MKKTFTILIAAIAAILMMALPEKVVGQTKDNVTIHYSGSTTTTMTGNNDAATVGLNASNWSVIGDKGGSNNIPGLNKDGTIRLYVGGTNNTGNGSYFTVTNSDGNTITSITMDVKSGTATILVGNQEVTGSDNVYSINSTSFKVQNQQESGQVQINSISVTYSTGGTQTVATPQISLATGTYYGTQFVTLSCNTNGASIYYTKGENPGTPTSSSTHYEGAIKITKTTTIKAIAVKEGMQNSDVATSTITIQPAVFNQDWEGNMNGWKFVSVEGSQVWAIATYNNNKYAKMSGYENGYNANEDWIISPSFNLGDYTNPVLTFTSARSNHNGNNLKVYFSNNYAGGTNNEATWTELACTLPSQPNNGYSAFTSSGNISLSAYTGENCYIGFKYTSTTSAATTWEVDDIQLVSALPTISANPVNIAYSATTGNAIPYTIANFMEGTVEASTEATWITGFSYNTPAASSQVNFTTTANTGARRSAVVTLSFNYGGATPATTTVTVTQYGVPAVTLDRYAEEINHLGDTPEFIISYESLSISSTTNFDVNFYESNGTTSVSKPGWIDGNPEISGNDTDGYTLTMLVTPNTTATSRYAYFKVYVLDDEATEKESALVTITQTPPTAYTATVGTHANGTLTINGQSTSASVLELAEVTVAATANSGYELTSLYYYETDAVNPEHIAISLETKKFNMPSNNVTVDAVYSQLYLITTSVLPNNDAGTIATDASAYEGENVTVIVEAESGYAFSSIAVTKTGDSSTEITTSGNATDGFTFEMPAYPVTVTATFVAILDITFTVNGTQKTVKHINQGSQIGELPVLADSEIPSGLAFKGWTSSTGYFDATTPAATITEETIPASSTTYAALFCVSTPGESHWTLTSDAPAAGDDVILAVLDGTTYYALFATSSALTRTSFSVSNNTITGDIPSSWEVVNASYTSGNVTYTGLGLFSGSYQTVQNEDKELYLHINSSAGKIATTFQNGVFDFDASGSGYTLTSKVNSRYLKYASNAFGVSSNSSDLCTLYVFKKVTEPGSESNYTTIVTDENISGEVTDLRIFESISATAAVTNSGTIHIFNGGVLDMGTYQLTNETPANLIIEDGGQLVLKSTNTGVQATFEKDITSAEKDAEGNWYTISTPTGGINITSVTNLVDNEGHTLQYNLFRYDEPTHMWEAYNPTTGNHEDFTTLEKGRGYLYRNNGKPLSFAGEVNVGDVTGITLKRQATVDKMKGFNLIGNPFGHNIYKGEGASIDNTDLADGFYYLNDNGGWQAGIFSTPIAPQMGILVQVSNTEITSTSLTIKDNTVIPTEESKYANDNLMFSVSNNDYEDVTYAMFHKGYGLNKINHRNADIPMLYINHDNDDYAIAMLNDDTKAFNLNFEAKTAGRYTLSYKAEGEFTYLHVIDRLTGADVDMLMDGEYSFIATPNDNKNRFIVSLGYIPDYGEGNNDIFAFQSGNEILVSGSGELQIFDITGRSVMSTTINGAESINLSAQGVYILRLVGAEVKTQKIVVK